MKRLQRGTAVIALGGLIALPDSLEQARELIDTFLASDAAKQEA
jgi:hypothetical protein